MFADKGSSAVPRGPVSCWPVVLALLAGLFAVFTGGAEEQTTSAPRRAPYRIVTTVAMVTDIVRQVAGERAQVLGLIGEGVDPHLYKATRNDIAALQAADVIFYCGLMLEGKMSDVLVRLARGGKPVFAVTELLEEKYLLEPPEMEGHYDPHVWMDVSAWSRAVEAVAAALAGVDPPGAAYYGENARRYRAELEKLHEYVQTVIASIPPRRRTLITAHDAFNYFGRAYGLRVLGIQGISTESEAGLEDINRLVREIVENDIQAVFVESSVAEKNVKALIEGAAVRGKKVRIGGTLFSDAMGPPGTYEGTYIGMIDHNATVIARALGGSAPPRGIQGRLSLTE